MLLTGEIHWRAKYGQFKAILLQYMKHISFEKYYLKSQLDNSPLKTLLLLQEMNCLQKFQKAKTKNCELITHVKRVHFIKLHHKVLRNYILLILSTFWLTDLKSRLNEEIVNYLTKLAKSKKTLLTIYHLQ